LTVGSTIENALHWTLDVTFREDESRIRKDAAPEHFAIMRLFNLDAFALILTDTLGQLQKNHIDIKMYIIYHAVIFGSGS